MPSSSLRVLTRGLLVLVFLLVGCSDASVPADVQRLGPGVGAVLPSGWTLRSAAGRTDLVCDERFVVWADGEELLPFDCDDLDELTPFSFESLPQPDAVVVRVAPYDPLVHAPRTGPTDPETRAGALQLDVARDVTASIGEGDCARGPGCPSHASFGRLAIARPEGGRALLVDARWSGQTQRAVDAFLASIVGLDD